MHEATVFRQWTAWTEFLQKRGIHKMRLDEPHDGSGSLQGAGDNVKIRVCGCLREDPWSSCYSANTDHRSQAVLRDVRIRALSRKEKACEFQEHP